MSFAARMTFEQFEKLPDDGLRHELLKGQHIVSLTDTVGRSNIRHAIQRLVRPYVREHQLGEMYMPPAFSYRRIHFCNRPTASSPALI